MLSFDVQRLAAKCGALSGSDAEDFHPLICHMADVAAVALALWDEALSGPVRKLIADGMGLPEPEARLWAAFVAGLHDMGKASKPFQAKLWGCAERLAGTGLSTADIRDAAKLDRDAGYHGTVSAVQLRPLFKGMGVSEALAWRLALVAGGHHGIFPNPGRGQGEGQSIREATPAEGAPWQRVRRELFMELRAVLGITSTPTGSLPNASAMALAGLVTVADWIGSNTDFFPYSPGRASDPAGYFEQVARRAASEALARLHWLAFREPTPRGFGELFELTPRPLQRVADDLRARPGLRLAIVEAPMGEGKTEAALLLAHHWNVQGARGAYVALPTQATANQLHRRVTQFLERIFPGANINLMLVHGGTLLQDDAPFLPANVDDGEGPGAVAAGEWFLPRKRSLLAPFGVGTVDQALMAVLQVKHVFVRLSGLAGKAVVIDEVHAYDTYMTGLLERLLEWLGALESPVVMLSATLPTQRREALARAYLRGMVSEAAMDAGGVPGSAYPRVTIVDSDGVAVRHFDASAENTRSLGIDLIKDDLDEVRLLLGRELEHGGCAVVICNTVARAQETYRAMKAEFGDSETGLFHARFVFDDRDRIEGDCLAKFGPRKDNPKRPDRYVLVATQVVEQSLDLDFDVMVTDLAPLDLLLQRSGRLQRHQRGERRHPPTLHIRMPALDAEGLPVFDRGATAVYDEHILLRTWWALQGRERIEIPGDVQGLIDAVYEEGEAVPEGVDGALAKRWRETWAAMGRKRAEERREAHNRRIRTPVDEAWLEDFQKDPVEEDNPDLHPALQAVTRLAGPSVDVVLLRHGDMLPIQGERPSRREVRKYLRSAVNISRRDLVRILARESVPSDWLDSPSLRRHRLLVLDEESEAAIPGFTIRYDPQLGLEVEATGSEGTE